MLIRPNCSRFGWDLERQVVTAEKLVWDAYLQPTSVILFWLVVLVFYLMILSG